MACVVMANIVMANIVMANMVMAVALVGAFGAMPATKLDALALHSRLWCTDHALTMQ